MFSAVTRSWTNVTPCSIQGLRIASSGSKSMMVMRLGIDMDVPQQNGQRASRHGAETNEQDSMRERRHPHVLLDLVI